ncbi:SRPBCC family protein [Anthocerotibacter panamensis]|uniref:SRPBCC family protein n=1 Tax=Anthocerotibacter panamensis TaxID=2857077 RepID=UPI001C407215|nr:SRPBCC family protein [Anthocerotibacter panamensis]
MALTLPTFSFERESLIAAPVEQVFAFHTDPQNLLVITPPEYRLRLLQAPTPIARGTLVIFEISFGAFTLPWLSRISEFEPPQSFTDIQEWGPFAQYRHTHHFIATTDMQTLLRDTVVYTPPLGWWGLPTEPFLIRPFLETLFTFRHQKTQELLLDRR